MPTKLRDHAHDLRIGVRLNPAPGSQLVATTWGRLFEESHADKRPNATRPTRNPAAANLRTLRSIIVADASRELDTKHPEHESKSALGPFETVSGGRGCPFSKRAAPGRRSV